MAITQRFLATAQAVADLVARVPPDRLDGDGLGDWDLRALIGHTSRSLVTVQTYLDRPADAVEVTSAAAYYAGIASAADPAQVRERGRQAGAALGADPAAAFAQLVHRAGPKLSGYPADHALQTIAGGMLLGEYLRTRLFELVVHGLDIARATGLTFEPPPAALADAVELAGQVAVLTGQGQHLLLAVTGRQPLPPGFSVV